MAECGQGQLRPEQEVGGRSLSGERAGPPAVGRRGMAPRLAGRDLELAAARGLLPPAAGAPILPVRGKEVLT